MMYLGGALCLWIVRGWKVGQLEELDRALEARGMDRADVREAEKRVQEGLPISPASRGDALPIYSGWRCKDLARRMCIKKIV